jgi:predicted PP-loop superfamily ATPase
LILFDFGLHGVVSYRVSQRIREIDIRMALGGDGRDVLRLVLRRALRPEFRTVPVIILRAVGSVDAEPFQAELAEKMRKFKLELHPDAFE